MSRGKDRWPSSSQRERLASQVGPLASVSEAGTIEWVPHMRVAIDAARALGEVLRPAGLYEVQE